jgi:hypothetical protein
MREDDDSDEILIFGSLEAHSIDTIDIDDLLEEEEANKREQKQITETMTMMVIRLYCQAIH